MVSLPRTATASPFESLGPSLTLRGTFENVPFARLLVDGLRHSVTGRMLVMVDGGATGEILFDRGVPVKVSLPWLGPSLAEVLARTSHLDRDQQASVQRLADKWALTESQVLRKASLVDEKQLALARRQQAESQIVRLIGIQDGSFEYSETLGAFDPGTLLVLRPLQLVFEGLRRAPESIRQQFLSLRGPRRVRTAYPKGSDLFLLGNDLETAVVANPSVEELTLGGWDRDVAQAAVACFHLAGMLEAQPVAPSRAMNVAKEGTRSRPRVASTSASIPRQSSGLMVIPADKSKTSDKTGLSSATRPKLALPSRGAHPSSKPGDDWISDDYGRLVDEIEERLLRYEGKTYWQMLRVTAESDRPQLDRAFRFLSQKYTSESKSPGERAALGLVEEAYEVLTTPELANRYAVLANRSEVELEQRIRRTLVVLGEKRDPEAEALVRVVRRGHPRSPLARALEDTVNWLTTPPAARISTPRVDLFPAHSALVPAVIAITAQTNERWGGPAKARALWLAKGRMGHALLWRYAEFN